MERRGGMNEERRERREVKEWKRDEENVMREIRGEEHERGQREKKMEERSKG